jgi:hypothetical protein
MEAGVGLSVQPGEETEIVIVRGQFSWRFTANFASQLYGELCSQLCSQTKLRQARYLKD